MERNTQQEAQNILSSIPILKLIDKTKIDVLTVDNENNLRTSQPKKASCQCQTVAKVTRSNSHWVIPEKIQTGRGRGGGGVRT